VASAKNFIEHFKNNTKIILKNNTDEESKKLKGQVNHWLASAYVNM